MLWMIGGWTLGGFLAAVMLQILANEWERRQ